MAIIQPRVGAGDNVSCAYPGSTANEINPERVVPLQDGYPEGSPAVAGLPRAE
jgi:hypothetical protein